MVKLKNVIFIMAIGLAVLFSGCAGTQENTISETAKPTPTAQATAVQTPVATTAAQVPGYQVQITEIKYLQDCIVAAGTKQSCSLVNLEVKNNNMKSADVKILKNSITLKGGRTLDMYISEAGLSNLCVRQIGLEFKLNTNTNQNVGLCYQLLKKSDAPVLNVEVMINGERKEYPFDLTKYGLTD